MLQGSDMASTFNMLRANDLIWSFVVNNYLLGNEPFQFDLLYWNSDATRMPAKMHSYYLRNMYHSNRLAKGELELAGQLIDLGTVDIPTYFISTREDHIAPWRSTYRGTQLLGGTKRFVLAASGHIAGVVNPPGKRQVWVLGERIPAAHAGRMVRGCAGDGGVLVARLATLGEPGGLPEGACTDTG